MALEDRVMFLERTVSAHYDEISHNETMLLGMAVKMQENFYAVRRDVAVIKGDVETLKGDVAVIKGDVEILKGDVGGIRSDLTLFKGEVNRRLDGLEQRFTSVDDQLKQIFQLLTNRS